MMHDISHVHNYERSEEDELAPKERARSDAVEEKRIDVDKARFELGDPQLNVLSKLGAGLSVEGLVRLLGLLGEDKQLESVLPQSVHTHITLKTESLLRRARALLLGIDDEYNN